MVTHFKQLLLPAARIPCGLTVVVPEFAQIVSKPILQLSSAEITGVLMS